MKKYVVSFLAMGLLLVNCNTDDDVVREPAGPDPDPDAQVDVQAQDFIWKALNLWYFWQQDVPNLADDRFSTSAEYTEFLQSESDPGEFFDNKLRFAEDRFTFYRADYRELVNSLSGTIPSNGLEFGLARFRDSDDVYGYVEYVLPNTDAATKDIKRGDIFTGVNGQVLNLGNYIELLFGESTSYTLNMADLVDNTIIPNDKEVQLSKSVIQVNPIFLEKIIETNGRKIGYLMYNRFLNEFDGELNEVFGRFESEGITDLILDLRYNPGGRVLSAQRIASMIYGSNDSDVFSTLVYNDKYTAFLNENNVDLNRYFQDSVVVLDEDDQKIYESELKTLNLDKVHIIALGSSASASELVINGLEPYMDVIHVGDTTTGKNEFSRTMVDDRANNYIYESGRVDNINPDNSWAIQPLLGRSSNADGFFDYTEGLVQDIFLEEDLGNFGVLGDPNEPLLAIALENITGATSKRSYEPIYPIDEVTSSSIFTPIKDNMYIDNVPLAPAVKE
ncbi:carboxyl-terminal protease [Aggregatimonas sangjinii]|uniref:Carboxyl-terminal protease n=1 Tax=Aggregatimonas sangjinii TaxID=2583587 RepID=A0A5B7SUB4_9FLAO|nr:S41 family peptidase [Aggregatimonas sangjinii]QCX00334.1 carboxyl-terminal protease [Aggregatimonas sangjinii]